MHGNLLTINTPELMIKTGKITPGQTPCIKCGAASVVVVDGEAYCKKHKKRKKDKYGCN